MSNKYNQKRFNSAKKSTTDALNIASKRAIQKTAEASGNVIANKIEDKTTSVSNRFPKELYSQNEEEIEIPSY